MFNINNNHNHRKIKSRNVLNAIWLDSWHPFGFISVYLSEVKRIERVNDVKIELGILMHNKFKRIDGISVGCCCFFYVFADIFWRKILVTKSNQNKIVLLMVSIGGSGCGDGGDVVVFCLSVCCAVIAG